MSGKTKAELGAENAWLRSENAIQREQLQDCYEEIDWLLQQIKILNSASDDTIKKLAKLSKPRIRREWAALKRKKYLQLRFIEHRKKHNKTESRIKANDDMADKFGGKHRLKVEDGKPGRQLIATCKD